MQVYFFDIMDDKSFQLLAAKNLLAGNGLAINQVFADNTMQAQYKPLTGWPPGYSVLLAPLLFIFNNNFIVSALCFDILCVFPFFYYLYRLLTLLSLTAWLKNLFILGSGFFFYPFASYNCTDFAAVICLLAGFYYTVNFAVHHKKASYIFFIISALFLAALLRYLYLPVIFSVPAALFAAGIIHNQKKWVRGAISIAVILSVLVIALVFFQKQQTGEAVYVMPVQKGIYFQHLLKASPFIPGSFFDTQILTTFVAKVTGKTYPAIMQVVVYAGILCLLFLLILSVGWMSKMKSFFSKQLAVSMFTFMGILMSITTVLTVFYLSVRNDAVKEPFYNSSWTFAEEFRYYAFCIVFIQLAAFVYLFSRYKELTKFWKVIAVVTGIVLGVQFVHRIYFVTKAIITKSGEFYFFEDKKKQVDFILSLPVKIKKQFPDHEVAVTSTNASFCNLAGLSNIKAIYNPDFLNNPDIFDRKHLTIIAVLSKPSLSHYGEFIKSRGTRLEKVIGDQYFYISDGYSER